MNIRERFDLLVLQGECNENQEIQKVTTLCVLAVCFSCWAFGILIAVVYTGNDSVFRGRSYFIGHCRTAVSVLGRLCCIPAGHSEQSFTEVMLKFRTGYILQREKRILW